VIVFAAINNPNNVDEDLNALLFSIYFAATTSLTSTEVANLPGHDKSPALNNFKQGLEQSFAGSNILRHAKSEFVAGVDHMSYKSAQISVRAWIQLIGKSLDVHSRL
jgi:hypothetical protein